MRQETIESDIPTAWLHLKAPVEFFELIDEWCEKEQARRGMRLRPSRPAAIRFIVYNFLMKTKTKKKGSATPSRSKKPGAGRTNKPTRKGGGTR
jgi:hypothetical protein